MASRTAPTLTDVAAHAGVSTATVSRCLNAPDKVSEDARNRVNAAVQALGYTPNFAAQAMASRRSKTIGTVIPTMENAIFAQGLEAFQERLGQSGYTLLVASSNYDPDLEERQIRTLAARGADGLLLIGRDRSEKILNFMKLRNIPAVISWSLSDKPQQTSIGFDNRQAMAELTHAVLEMGHRRIGLISARTATNDRARDRLEGVRDALQAYKINLENHLCRQTAYSIDNGAKAMTDLMSLPDRPTAVICGNDVLAAGAVVAAQSMGIAVGSEVSVTGFDDIELARVTTPALTTVHVPHAEMGTRAADLLLSALQGPPRSPLRIELPTTIRHRASLGRAPDK